MSFWSLWTILKSVPEFRLIYAQTLTRSPLLVIMAMPLQHEQCLPFALQKLLGLMRNGVSSKDHTTRRNSHRRFKFDNHILVQARQDLDDLLTRQAIPLPTQSSQSIEERQVLTLTYPTDNRIRWMERWSKLFSIFQENQCQLYPRMLN